MNGVARKSLRQEPGLERAWPPPSAPAAVCWKVNIVMPWLSVMTETYHGKTVAYPEVLPVSGAVGYIHILTVHGYHIGLNLTNHTPAEYKIVYTFITRCPGNIYLEMNSGMACSATGIIGMGSFVESQ